MATAIVGYNYAQDTERSKQIERLEREKITKEDVYRQMDKLEKGMDEVKAEQKAQREILIQILKEIKRR